MKILGIETSCDETAAAVVEDGKRLLSNVVATSLDLHAQYGGVVPEIAARSHIESITPVVEAAVQQAFDGQKSKVIKSKARATEDVRHSTFGLSTEADPWDQIDGIAVTYGAGLGGSLLIGVLAARTLAITKKKPLYGVNHVEGHVYANFLTETKLPDYVLPGAAPSFPMLALIVSGGHTQLALFRDHFDYTLLGQTHDDAIGEAFDKVAKIVGLPYPGGPSIAKKALEGNAEAFTFPKAKLQGKYDFSFSGLKTAVLRAAQAACGKTYELPSSQLPGLLNEAQKANIAASFQRIAIETVVDKTLLAYEEFRPASVVIAGGVAANQELRRQLTEKLPLPINYTDIKLCTDNGAMIATLGCFKAMLGQPSVDPYSLDIEPNLSM